MRGIAIYVALIGALALLAGSAQADDAWSRSRVLPTTDKNWATYTPTTTTGDTQSPTLDTGMCSGGITFTAFGSLTGMAQLCISKVDFDTALNTDQCQNINLTTRDGAGTHSVQIYPPPKFFRIASVTGSDSTLSFMVTCTGTK